MPKNIIAQIFVTLVSVSILYVPFFPAAALRLMEWAAFADYRKSAVRPPALAGGYKA